VNKRIVILIAISLTAWLVVVYPAFVLGGEAALIHNSVALALCLAPTVATMLWAGWAGQRTPEQQLVMVLGGTGVRMGVALGAGLLLSTLVPLFAQPGFWIWLLVFYLLTLTVEMVLIVKGLSRTARTQGASSSRSAS
jgi:hypothetical protein